MSWGQDPNDSERRDPQWGNDPQRSDPRRGGDPQRSDPQWGSDPQRDPEWGRDPRWARDPHGDPRWGRRAGDDTLRPMDLGDVLDGMFRIARTHWRAFLIGLGVVVVPLSLLSGLLLAQTIDTTPGLLETLQDPELAQGPQPVPDAATLARVVAASALSSLATLLLTPLIYGIAVHIAATGYRAGQVDPMASVRAAARRYFALLGAGVLVVAAFLALWIGAVVVAGVLATTMGDSVASTVAAVIAIGLVSVVAAVILAVRLALVVPAIVVEGAGPASSLRRSNDLVRGGTGRTFVTLLVMWIIVAIISFVLSLPFQAAIFGGGPVAAAIATVGTIISSLVTNSLVGAALVLVYFDRRVRVEGYDLTELAHEVERRSETEW